MCCAPYMVEISRKRQVEWILCRRALKLDRVDAGLGRILPRVHICANAPEKVLALAKRRAHGARNGAAR